MKTHFLRYLLAALLLTAWCTNAGCVGDSAPADAGAGAGSLAPVQDHPSTGFGGPIAPQGGTITSITPTVGGGLAGGGTAGPVTLGLDSAGCASGNVKKWNGSSWVCGIGGISNSAGLHIIPVSDGTNLIASSATDDGTTFAVNTNKFTVTEANGNTAVAGTLTADGGSRVFDATGNGITATANSVAVNNGTGLIFATGALTYDNTIIQSRVAGTCTAPQSILSISATGTVTCTTASATTSAGTTNTIPKYTSASNIGNSSLTDTGVTLSTTDLVSFSTTSTGGDGLIVTYNGAGSTVTRAAETVTNSTTYNTTSGALNAYGVRSTVTASRSAGANNLTNIGVYTTASGAQVNQAIYADAGDVLLNQTSGTTTIGGATTITAGNVGTAAALTVNRTDVGIANDRSAIAANNTGSYDSTTVARTAYGVKATVNATRSAGTNTVNQVALYGTAVNGSGLTSIALKTDNGDVQLNQTSGATTIGGGTTINNVLTVAGLTNSNTVSATNSFTAQTIDRNVYDARVTGTYNTTAGVLQPAAFGALVTSTRSAGTNALSNTGYYANVSGGQVNWSFYGAAGDIYNAGNLQIGGTTTIGGLATLNGGGQVNGAFTITGTDSSYFNNGANQDTYIRPGLAAGKVWIGDNGNAEVDIGGTITPTIFNGSLTSTAGANLLGEMDYSMTTRSDATGTVTDASFARTARGVWWTATGGTVSVDGFGFTSGTPSDGQRFFVCAVTSALSFLNENAGETTAGRRLDLPGSQQMNVRPGMCRDFIYDTSTSRWRTEGTLYQNGLASNGVPRWTGNNELAAGSITDTAGALSWGVTTTISAPGNTVNGGMLIQKVGTAQTTNNQHLLNITDTSTWNTTAGALADGGIMVTANPTRASGTNTLTTVAIEATAPGSTGVTGVALQTDAGNVLLTQTSGSVTINAGGTSTQTTTINGVTQAIWSATAQTGSATAFTGTNSGTYDLTSGFPLTVYGIAAWGTASKSAGTGILTNVALYASATSGDKPVALQTDQGDVLLVQTSGNITIGALANNAHVTFPTATNKPTVANCGTTPTVVGSDTAGFFTTTATPTTACAITFHTAYSSNVDCEVWDQTGAVSASPNYTVATTGITGIQTSGSAALASGVKVHWLCYDH